MKIFLNSKQLETIWRALKSDFHGKDISALDQSLLHKVYGLWQDAVYLETGGKQIGAEEERREHQTEAAEPRQGSGTAPELEEQEPGLRQRVPGPLHEDPEGKNPRGAGEGRQGPGSRGGSGTILGTKREGSGAEHQEEAIWDSGGPEYRGEPGEIICFDHDCSICKHGTLRRRAGV